MTPRVFKVTKENLTEPFNHWIYENDVLVLDINLKSRWVELFLEIANQELIEINMKYKTPFKIKNDKAWIIGQLIKPNAS